MIKITVSNRFYIDIIQEYTILLNGSKSRGFLCLVISTQSKLQQVTSLVDNVLVSFRQPVYYSDPKFHVRL